MRGVVVVVWFLLLVLVRSCLTFVAPSLPSNFPRRLPLRLIRLKGMRVIRRGKAVIAKWIRC
jgi:hypothetical protein